MSRGSGRLGGLRRIVEGDRRRGPALQPLKLWAIEFVTRRLGARTVADLGGVWAVEAGYTFHAASQPAVERVTLVDTGITPSVRARAEACAERVRPFDGDFTDPATIAAVGDVDVVLLFDVLLHQVDPDWDEVLRRWAPQTQAFVVVQPTWRRSDEAVRLPDLGRERYLELVPDEENARLLFSRLDEVHPRYGKPWRDVHEVWQWGIPDAALERVMRELGFRRIAYVDDGTWRDLDAFGNHLHIFAKERDGRD